uniref:Uncharacterized protein n=1 Tax=Anguilla anguilla TaxID=7936 RepID=A0A0E9R3Q7_ANGAN
MTFIGQLTAATETLTEVELHFYFGLVYHKCHVQQCTVLLLLFVCSLKNMLYVFL